MTATPAWPPASCPRLYSPERLGEGLAVRVDAAQAHYLISVMRTKIGDPVKLFDGQTGEWLALAETIGKRDIILRVEGQIRPLDPVPDLWLAAAPIRRAHYDLVAEKACELGVARFMPVLTQRCVVDKVNTERLRAQMIEAAEQCGRTSLPEIAAPVSLKQLLASLAGDRTLFFADEEGGTAFTAAASSHPGPAIILIGPEGGFDNQERALIKAHGCAVAVSLGPRILRAETAAIAATSLWMASVGDWSVLP
jgi:16S rRNA (uracil1498-N3)-methyltransferase